MYRKIKVGKNTDLVCKIKGKKICDIRTEKKKNSKFYVFKKLCYQNSNTETITSTRRLKKMFILNMDDVLLLFVEK
ncbi:hypothetical protein STCU_12268 [Strigomonas culicis]|uniref:Uncharacterized protein n=1 Tax=Strigomonas culicis TaxID=28005 RepID=S9TB31_9TRYP|nr:hypothetical protein STCU_12268 [Strigomonas culicis]|eukprot:EPY15192.1 hypothetical protein STCU_12268 [Strigomonas culicis]